MQNGWKERITDQKEQMVFEALSDPDWDFRTVAGVAKETGLPEDKVKGIFERYPDLIRRSPIPDARGRELYTLRSRPITRQERLAQARTIISKSVF